jgi:5-methylcytosine-specific restriction endonuclease McrA
MSNTPKKLVKSVKKLLKDYVKKNNIKCAYCGKPYDAKRRISLDHVTPKSSFGLTDINNLIVSCDICNSVKKKNMSLEEFILKYPQVRLTLNKYLNKMKSLTVNGKNYYLEISWVKDYF